MRRPPRRRTVFAAALAIAGSGLLATSVEAAAYDASVTLPAKPGSDTVSFDGHAPFNNGQANLLFDDATGACNPNDANGEVLRDEHHVKVDVPSKVNPRYDVLIRFQIDWTPHPTDSEPMQDIRMDLYGPDGKLVASSDSSQTSEGVNVTAPIGGIYDMVVCAFQTTPDGQDYTGTVTASLLRPPPSPRAAWRRRADVPPVRGTEGEGVRRRRAVDRQQLEVRQHAVHRLHRRVRRHVQPREEDVEVDARQRRRGGPVQQDLARPDRVHRLQVTGRTFVSQLLFVCSGAAFTDDDFASPVTPSEGCGSGINGFDHQTFGGGPYPKGVSPLLDYPHAVYYCSQAQALALGGATCARSDTGGLTFNDPVEIFHSECSGIHGHVRVAPDDGTVYVPNTNCARQAGGRRLPGRRPDLDACARIPDSFAGQSDPSVSAGADGTLYFGYADGTGRAKVAVSRDHGKTWSRSVDAGGPFGIRNTEFAEVIAGDGDRAAFAFLGTPTRRVDAGGGVRQEQGRRRTYHRRRMAPLRRHHLRPRPPPGPPSTRRRHDPVQRGCIWNSGGSKHCRNLLDFNDITVDKTGHVMVGYADGCTGDCVHSVAAKANTFEDQGAIAHQMSGLGLFARYDPKPAAAAGHGNNAGSGAPGGSGAGANGAQGSPLADTGQSPLVPLAGVLLLLAGAGLAASTRVRGVSGR